MKRFFLIIVPVFMAVMLIFTQCNEGIVIDDISDDEQENGEEQSHFNVVELNKTIPVINEFLAGLPSESTDEQKLEALTVWLKSYPGYNDATILCVSCIYTLPVQSEISISVSLNGITEDYILDISMSNPLTAICFHEHY